MQAQRDREREEQMMQQRQQQHYQNITTQQMFPKSPDATRAGSSVQSSSGAEVGLPPAYNADLMPSEHGNGITLAVFAQQLDNKVASEQLEEQQQQQQQQLSETAPGDSTIDQTDAGAIVNGTNGANGVSAEHITMPEPVSEEGEGKTAATTTYTASNGSSTTPASPTSTAIAAAAVVPPKATTPPPPAPATTTTPTPAAPVKKEKLGGFLPNGCIFPRFKNNKHKDKDSSNHKESKSKEKTLLNALKKSKEKKVAPSEQTPLTSEKSTSDNGTTQYEKNCINNLECEVQKLDLNNSNNDNNMFIKLKVAPSPASAPAAAAAAAK